MQHKHEIIFGNGARIGGAHQALRNHPSRFWELIDFGLNPNFSRSDDNNIKGTLPFRGKRLVPANLVKRAYFTHAHVDHIAAAPLLPRLYPHLESAYMTEATAMLAEEMIWKQSVAIANREGKPHAYSLHDVERFLTKIKIMHPGEEMDFEHFRVLPISNGHILGSVSLIFIPKNGSDPVFISGDTSFQHQELIEGATPIPERFKRFSIALVESTNLDQIGYRRENVKSTFIDFVLRVLGRSGQLIVGAFGIGRSPEIYAILKRSREVQEMLRRKNARIYVDGSSKEGLRIYRKNISNFRYDEEDFVKDFDQTNHLMMTNKPMILIASSGMYLEGSKSFVYAKHSLGRENNAIALVGWQAPNTPGYKLEESQKKNFVNFGRTLYWRACDVGRFHFSAHFDGKENLELQDRLGAEVTVLNHGNPKVIEDFIASHPERNLKIARAGKMVAI